MKDHRSQRQRAGNADADGADRRDVDPCLPPESAHRLEDGAGHGIRSPPRRKTDATHDRARVVDRDRVGLGAPDVEPDLHRPVSPRERVWLCARISP